MSAGATRTPLEFPLRTERSRGGRSLRVFVDDGEVVLTMEGGRGSRSGVATFVADESHLGYGFLAAICEWLDVEPRVVPQPRSATASWKWIGSIREGRTNWERHALAFRHASLRAEIFFDLSRGRGRLVATTRAPAVLSRLLQAAVRLPTVTRPGPSGRRLELTPFQGNVNGAWTRTAYFAASFDEGARESTLWRWDRLEGAPRPVCTVPGRVTEVVPSPNEQELAVTVYFPEIPGRHQPRLDRASLMVVEAESGRARTLVRPTTKLSGKNFVKWSPDGDHLVVKIHRDARGAAGRGPRASFVQVCGARSGRVKHETAWRAWPIGWDREGIVLSDGAFLGRKAGHHYLRWDVGAEPEEIDPPAQASPDGEVEVDLKGHSLVVTIGGRSRRISLRELPGAVRSLQSRPVVWWRGHDIVVMSEERFFVIDVLSSRVAKILVDRCRGMNPCPWDARAVLHLPGGTWSTG